jgi:hypothetical protein
MRAAAIARCRIDRAIASRDHKRRGHPAAPFSFVGMPPMKRFAISCFLVCSATFAFAQQPVRVMTLTRTVKIFSELENQLDDARRSHDETTLGKLLAANFEQRSGAAPAQPTPRADWLAQAPAAHREMSQMAVHEYGNVAVVSFVDAAQHAFVVDVWNKADDHYALAVRYVSTASAQPQTKPENPAK